MLASTLELILSLNSSHSFFYIKQFFVSRTKDTLRNYSSIELKILISQMEPKRHEPRQRRQKEWRQNIGAKKAPRSIGRSYVSHPKNGWIECRGHLWEADYHCVVRWRNFLSPFTTVYCGKDSKMMPKLIGESAWVFKINIKNWNINFILLTCVDIFIYLYQLT